MGVMEIPLRPRAIDELQAASAVGQGKLYQVYDELLRARGVPTAQVLLTFFDMSARTHYLNARQTLRKLLDWRVVPVINENDTTTTDEISFGNNDFLAAQVAILLGAELLLLLTDADGVFTADPRDRPDRAGSSTRSTTSPSSRPSTSVTTTSPLGSGGMRSKVVAAEMATAAGIPTVIASGLSAGNDPPRRSRRRPVGTRFAGPRGPLLELQAVAEVRQAGSRPGARRRGRGARAAGGRHQPAAGRGRRGRRRASTPATRSRSRTSASAVGKGICNYSAAELRQVRGLKSARRARAAAARERGGGPPGLLRARVTCSQTDGRRTDHIRRRRSAPRPSARRARWRRSAPASRTVRSRRSPTALIEHTAGDPRGQRPRSRGRRARPGSQRRADRPARARRQRDRRRWPRGSATIAALPDPVGEVIDGSRAAQRARRAQGPRPARRGRGRLRGAAERDDRRRRAVPEIGQRDRAARLELGGPLERRARRGRLGGRDRRRAARRARCRSSPAAAARSSPSSPRRRASST